MRCLYSSWGCRTPWGRHWPLERELVLTIPLPLTEGRSTTGEVVPKTNSNRYYGLGG
jgi:hypothetical protein